MKNNHYIQKQAKNCSRWILTGLLLFCSFNSWALIPVTVDVPGNATPALAASYTSLADALTALNNRTVTGPIIFTLGAGSETAPNKGLTIGSGTLNPSLSNSTQITFINTGGTAILNAGVGTSLPNSTSVPLNEHDGILRLLGADWITLDGLTLVDNNAALNATMEYGIGLFKLSASDGCQNNTIKNCNITLNQAFNNGFGTSPAVEGSKGINIMNTLATTQTTAITVTAASGSNSFNKIYSNTIQRCQNGIVIIGFAAASPFTFADQSNDVGGTSASTGNTVKNFGGSGSAPSAAIRFLAQYNVNASYNTINSNDGGGGNHTNQLKGIHSNTATSASATITFNNIILKAATATSSVVGIDNLAGSTQAGNTITMSNNTISAENTVSSTGDVYGISNSSTAANLVVNTNTISLSTGATTSFPNVFGINHTGAVPVSINENNNVFSVTYTSGTTSSYSYRAISHTTGTSATCALTANGNSLQSATFSGVSTGEFSFIYVGVQMGSETITNNTVSNITVPTTGSTYLFYLSNSTSGNIDVNNNSCASGFTRTGLTGTFNAIHSSTSATGGTQNLSGNNFSNINLSTSGATILINWAGTGAGPTTNIFNNTLNAISNNNATAGTLTGILASGSTNLNVYTNSISNYTGSSSITGINIGTANTVTGLCYNNTITTHNSNSTFATATVTAITSTNGTNVSIYGNTIGDLAHTHATGSPDAPTLIGIAASGGTTKNVYKNKIYNLTGTGSAMVVNGLLISGSAIVTYNASNNLIGDLKAPSASGLSAVNGVNITSTSVSTTCNLYYNTIYLNASSSSGSGFGASGVFFNDVATLNLRNNIIDNISTPAPAGGIVAGIRRTTGTTAVVPANYSTLSNNNIIWVNPAAGVTSHLAYVEGTSSITNSLNTVADLKTFMGNRDQASQEQDMTPLFISLAGANAGFLHLIANSNTVAESGASNITDYTDDYDGHIRFGNPGYPNGPTGGTNPDIGADEFVGISPAPVITLNSITPAGNQCNATSRVISVDVTTPNGSINGVNITYNNGSPNTFPMNFVSGNTYTYTIPAASPTNTIVTWSVSATNTLGLTGGYIGTPYQDDILLPTYARSYSTINTTVCSNTAVNLVAYISDPTSVPPVYLLPPAAAQPLTDEDFRNITITKDGVDILNNTSTWNTLSGTIGTATGTAGSYSNFTSFGPYALAPGQNYSISLSSENQGTAGVNYMAAWIDYNGDGDFADTDENIFLSTVSVTPFPVIHTKSGSFTVPSGAVAGKVRMRVIAKGAAASSNPVATISASEHGEYEEYMVDILSSTLGTNTYSWSNGVSVVSTTNPATVTPVVTTTYTATVDVNLYGCTRQVVATPSPVVSIDNSAPTIQASNLIGTATTFQIPVSWVNGNGASRVAYINTINSFVDPVTGQNPTANSVWANAGQQCIFNGTGNSVTVTGLTDGTTYWVRVYESNCPLNRNYNTNTSVNNPGSFTTPVALRFAVARTTGNNYNSIMPTSLGGDNSGLVLNWNSISTGAARTNAMPIPSSTFVYQGSIVTAFSVCTDGFMVLLNANNQSFFQNNTNSMTSNKNIVSPFWTDLSAFPNNNSQTTLDNTMRYFISAGDPGERTITIEWHNMTLESNAGPDLNFQVVLDENDNSIKFNYGNIQLFNGNQNLRYSYSLGLNAGAISSPAQPGQVYAQQFENTTAFDYINAQTASQGANGLAISPEPHSSIKFTPGTYAGYSTPVPTPPSNDESGDAIGITPSTSVPTNIVWNNVSNTSNIFTTRYATHSSEAVCGGSATGKDVWFAFNATDQNVKVQIYASGGYIPRLQVLDANLNPLSPAQCVVGSVGAVAEANMTGLVAGDDYYVRVYNDQTGTTAIVTATVAAGAVTGYTVVNGGSAYQSCSAETINPSSRITITGGGGVNAVARPVITGGTVASITAGSAGTGYTSAPTVTVESPDWGITGEFAIIVFAKAANDECTTAIELNNLLNTGCVNGQNARNGVVTSAASLSLDPLCVAGGNADDDVWYKFTAVNNNTIVTVAGSPTFNPAFEVYNGGPSGDCVNKTAIVPPVCINAGGNGITEETTVPTTIGNVYFVRVFHYGAGSGGATATFDICVSSAVPQCIASPNNPPNGGNICNTGTTLSWPVSNDAMGYLVYLDAGAGPATTLVATKNTRNDNTYFTNSLPNGQYSWLVVPTNGVGSAIGCTGWTFNSVSIPSIIITPSSTTDLCQGGGGVQLTASGGTIYTWSPAAGLNVTTGSVVNALPSVSTTYTVTGSNVTGCSSTTSVTVTMNPIPTAPITISDYVCTNASTAELSSISQNTTPVGNIIMTEFVSFKGAGVSQGPGVIPPYMTPASTNEDLLEFTNIGCLPYLIGGMTVGDYANNSATAVHPYTFPPGLTIPPNGVVVLHLGTGTDDPANNYYHTGGTTNAWVSVPIAGFVLKSGNTLVDVVAVGATSYTFHPSIGVTGSDWSGFVVNTNSSAGVRRVASVDHNTSADWFVSSSSNIMNIGVNNGNFVTVECVTVNWYSDAGLTTQVGAGESFDPYLSPVPPGNTAGTYTYYAAATSAYCQSPATPAYVYVGSPLSVTIQESIAGNICGGVSKTLSTTIIGGGPGYTYSWSNGNTVISTNSTVIVSPTVTTTYTVSITDGCTPTGTASASIVITVITPPSVVVTPSSAAQCVTTPGSINLVASGADTYQWAPAAGLSSTVGSSVNADPLNTTTYTVTGTSTSTGCTASATAVVTVGYPITATATAAPDQVCSGGNSQLSSTVTAQTGSILISEIVLFKTGSGQTNPYPPYIDSNGDDFIELTNISASPFDLSGFKFADYPSNNAVATHPYTFLAGTIIPAGGVLVLQLSAGVNSPADNYYATGGSNAWSTASSVLFVIKTPGGGVVDAVGLESVVIAAGTGVTASDFSSNVSVSGAGIRRTASVDHNTGADWTAASVSNVQNLGTNNGVFSLPPSPVYSYSWTPSTFLVSNSIANPLAVSVTSTTTYTITITDVNGGCSASASASVSVVPLNTPTISGPSSICITSSGTLTSNVTGGGQPYEYIWSDGNTVVGTTPSITVSPSSTTSYTVTVTDVCGSEMTSSPFQLVVLPAPIISVTGTPSNFAICNNNGQVTLTGNGGVSYTWSPSTGLNLTQGQFIAASPSVTTTYTVIGTNSSGCTGTSTVTVIVSNPIVVSPNADQTIGCGTLNTTMHANATFPTNYTVDPITFNPIPTPGVGVTTLVSNSAEVIPLSTGTLDEGGWINQPIPFAFKFYGVDYNTFALGTNGFIVLGSGLPNTFGTGNGAFLPYPSTTKGRPAIAAMSSNLEYGDPANSTIVNYFVTGSSPSRKFVINIIDAKYTAGSNSHVTVQIILNEGSNTFEIHTTEVNRGNVSTANANIEGCQNAAANLFTVVPGRNATVYSVTTPDAYIFSPPSNVLTYSWSPTNNLVTATDGSPLVSNLTSTTTYTVTATNVYGCTATGSIVLTVNAAAPPPNITYAGYPNTAALTFCTPNSLLLDASGSYSSYSWSNGNTIVSTNATYSATTSGTYTVTGTISNGCSASSSVTVTVHSAVTPTISANPGLTICQGQTATLSAGNNNYSAYSWSDGNTVVGTNMTYGATTAATYTVTVTDATNGCTATASTTLIVNPSPAVPVITPSGPITLSCTGPGSSVMLVASGVGVGLSNQWNNFDESVTKDILVTVNDPTFTNLTNPYGFFLTVTDPGTGCTSSSNTVVITGTNCVTLSSSIYLQGYYRSASGLMDNNDGSNPAQGGLLYLLGMAPDFEDVDFVDISVMDPTSPYGLIETAQGLLQTNGEISVLFTSPNIIKGNSYYLKVNHRNSVETWSGAPVELNTTTFYSFTSDNAQSYGPNEVLVQNSPVIWAIFSGDVNQDFGVDITDFNLVDPDVQDGLGGYILTDVTGDGAVDIGDILLVDPNVQSGVGSIVP